jgi:hypothetical protein
MSTNEQLHTKYSRGVQAKTNISKIVDGEDLACRKAVNPPYYFLASLALEEKIKLV